MDEYKDQDEYEVFFQLLAEKNWLKKVLMEMPDRALYEILKIVTEVCNERFPDN